MWKRDQLLRDLTYNEKQNAPLVAQMIKDSLSDSGALEESVYLAFRSLGFETTKIGGKGKPDGIAMAVLGVTASGKREDYSLVYDAKSTKKHKIRADTTKISAIDRHRADYKSDYAVVVSIDFQGSDDANSAVNKEAKKHKVTLIKAKDLVTLVLLAAPKQLSWLDLKDLLDSCHTVIETSEWIEKIRDREIKKGPIKELIETTYELMKTDKEPPELSALRMKNDILKEFSKEELRNFVVSIQRIIPQLLSLEGDIVSIQLTPDKILSALNNALRKDIPPELFDAYINAFETK